MIPEVSKNVQNFVLDKKGNQGIFCSSMFIKKIGNFLRIVFIKKSGKFFRFNFYKRENQWKFVELNFHKK